MASTTPAILKQPREITNGPAALEWALAMIDTDRVLDVRVRGLSRTCEDGECRKCQRCEKNYGEAHLRLLGTFNADGERIGFIFWALLAEDRDVLQGELETERGIAPIKGWADKVCIIPAGAQVVFGLYNPRGQNSQRGWIAPCPHSTFELAAMFHGTDQLERTWPTGEDAARQAERLRQWFRF